MVVEVVLLLLWLLLLQMGQVCVKVACFKGKNRSWTKKESIRIHDLETGSVEVGEKRIACVSPAAQLMVVSGRPAARQRTRATNAWSAPWFSSPCIRSLILDPLSLILDLLFLFCCIISLILFTLHHILDPLFLFRCIKPLILFTLHKVLDPWSFVLVSLHQILVFCHHASYPWSFILVSLHQILDSLHHASDPWSLISVASYPWSSSNIASDPWFTNGESPFSPYSISISFIKCLFPSSHYCISKTKLSMEGGSWYLHSMLYLWDNI